MNATSAISGAAEEAAPWIEKLARLGFFARAVLYVTVGALAISVALGLGGTPQGSRGAMATLLQAPLGRVLLAVIAIGLFGHALWRAIAAVLDCEHHGKTFKGIAKRVHDGGIALICVALGVSAIKLMFGDRSAARDGASEKKWTARVLDSDGGETVLWLVALGLAGWGIYQLYRAWKAELAWSAPRWIINVSRFGIAARGVVFIVVGGLLASAVRTHDPSEAGGLAQSLRKLLELGRIPFFIVAVGLIAYGIYELFNARFRRIDIRQSLPVAT